ncbi:heptaprenyl diphosphate synthase [Microcella putealis]|uniref:Heptaprenyl diphosphate synthase n=1 Tax=Microcella putealis TaxID=337005 RepID=A0A4Q7LNK5_9MICO|nr:heptaprenyl diphosphate synthase [Microcella putealis]TQM23589.1 heptaprenyl diphosphate synthase [Microcella putealis]
MIPSTLDDRHTVIPSTPLARRSKTLSASLGLGEKLFASSEERRFADAIEVGLEKVEEGLLREVSFADDMADVTSRYLLEAGGKRIRPVLTLLTAQLGDGAIDDVITAAQAVEITHLASLYHDDVMDEAEMRRGVPSAQSVWGNSVAILTGDLLFARASKLVASLGERAIKLQADTFERLCLGQLHETLGPRPGDDPVEHYLQVLADKTGSLIAAAAQMGVIFSNACDEYAEPVVAFGEKIGVAFQLVDDVIDLSEPDAETGKPQGTDLRSGVATLPLLYLRREALTDPAAAALLERIERTVGEAEGVDGANGEPDPIREAEFAAAVAELRAHPVTERTYDEARRWADDAVAGLASLPAGPVKKALTKFAEAVVDRSR